MGKYLILKSGSGGVDTDDVSATAADVIKGKTAGVYGHDEPVIGTLELSGNVATGEVLTGKTYYTTNPKSTQTGTMPNRGAVSQALNAGGSYTVPAGYHNGSGKVMANSLAGQTSANATAEYISSGKTAWVNGSKITGTLATQGGSTTTPGTANKTIVTASKHVTGNIVVAGNGNLTAANIKKGVNIFGVTGTFQGYVPTATDLYLRGNNIKNWQDPNGKASLDSGQVTINNTSTVTFLDALTVVNFIGFSKLNIEITISATATSAGTNLSLSLREAPTGVSSNIDMGTISSLQPGANIYSFNLGAGQVSRYPRITFGKMRAAVFRIWLS